MDGRSLEGVSKHAKHNRKKRKKHKERGSLKSTFKLFKVAAKGDTQKLEKLLQSHRHLDINAFDAEGLTALHQAVQAGHLHAVEALLRHGADARAEDFQGNNPAHLAAAKGHLAVLALLLQAKTPPRVDAANAQGVTVQQLTDAALATADAEEPADFSGWSDAASKGDNWDQKLRENADFDEFGATSADWGSYEYSFGSSSTVEDEDTYARRMWEAMQRRKGTATGPSPAAAQTWGAADEAQQQRRKAAEDAQDRSRRILEEEQARDRAWRQAVQQGDLAARRASYEAKWHVFAAGSEAVSYASVPWLVEDKEDARAIILYGTAGAAEERKRLRLELMRWHPDKFVAKFGARLAAGEKDRVLEGVKRISQMLNSLSTA